MSGRTVTIFCYTFILAIWVVALWLVGSALMEAYGSGAPYYGRTTNMDKWDHPLPFVAVVLAAAGVLSYAFWWLSRGNAKG
jgi:hypothetical protein